MAKRSGVSFEICMIFVLFSLTFAKGDITRVSAMTGEEKQFDFSYPCNSARVTLHYAFRSPLYDSVDESLLLPANQDITFKNESKNNICLLHLKIDPVLRSDEGGYILTAYDGVGNILEDTRVGLRVDYPPGKAFCGWGKKKLVDDWGSLECTAWFVGSLGEITCFQNGMKVPPKDTPRDRDGILEQTMWVLYSKPAFCCAFLAGKSVDRLKCKDYTWDPCKNLSGASLSPESPISIACKEAAQKTEKKQGSNVVLHAIYLCVIGILVLIIFILPRIYKTYNYYKFEKNVRTTNSQSDHEDVEYDKLKTDED